MRCAGLIFIVVTACGPAVPGGSDEGSSGSGADDGLDASSEASSTSVGGTTSSTSSTSSTSVATSGVATTSGAATTMVDETTGKSGVVYRAVALPTDVPRVAILKQNVDAGFCTWVGLVYGSSGPFAIDTPESWAVEIAGINDVAESCDEDYPAMFGAVLASEGTGTIAFETPMGLLPEVLDVDVELTFESSLGGTPLTDLVRATGLKVEFG